MWLPVIMRGGGEGHRCYSGELEAMYLGPEVAAPGHHTRGIIAFLKGRKCVPGARVVLKSREGEGLACVGPEVGDRLDCCRISGQYGTAIQWD
jgi:hypothetical protein